MWFAKGVPKYSRMLWYPPASVYTSLHFAPIIWNSLPPTLIDTLSSLPMFKCELKTHLFASIFECRSRGWAPHLQFCILVDIMACYQPRIFYYYSISCCTHRGILLCGVLCYFLVNDWCIFILLSDVPYLLTLHVHLIIWPFIIFISFDWFIMSVMIGLFHCKYYCVLKIMKLLCTLRIVLLSVLNHLWKQKDMLPKTLTRHVSKNVL